MIERGTGNLLTADVDALVNPVNTVGVMGKGLALQFKKAFPEGFREYEAACKRDEVVVGRMHVVQRLMRPRLIFNFPTKKHWRQPSKLEYIRDGLVDLAAQIRALKVASIAVPPLGCGNGGLAWRDVRPRIEAALGSLGEVRVVLFEPAGAPAASAIVDRRRRPAMTPSRALLLASMNAYAQTGFDSRLSLLELQKLAYFLQAAGEPLRLDYKPHHYGPYADNLRKALRNIEGHFTSGLGDGRDRPDTPIKLLPGALEQALAVVESRDDSRQRLDRVARLIERYETPFGMELLATVHWALTHGRRPDDLSAIVEEVQRWNQRKRDMFKPAQIRCAWERLREQGWDRSPADRRGTI